MVPYINSVVSIALILARRQTMSARAKQVSTHAADPDRQRMLLHLAEQKETAIEGRKDKKNKKVKPKKASGGGGGHRRGNSKTPTHAAAAKSVRPTTTPNKKKKACEGRLSYGCGLLPAGHFALVVLWPLVVLFVLLLEILETLNAVLLETPIQLLRLISGDSIAALQVRCRSCASQVVF